MSHPYFEMLERERKERESSGAASSPGSAYFDMLRQSGIEPNTNLAQPEGFPVNNVYDDSDDNDLSKYLGNLTELTGEFFLAPFKNFARTIQQIPDVITNPNEISEHSLIKEEDVSVLRGKFKQFFNRSLGAINDVTQEINSTGAINAGSQVLGRVFEAAKSNIGSMAAGVAEDPVGVIPIVTKGALEMFVEPIMTAATGKSIVGDEVLDANSEEMAEGVLGAAALAPSIGIYTKLAKGTKGVIASSAWRNMTGEKLGLLGKAIGREYTAQAAAGLVQEGIMSPEDISVEMIARNIANPVLLATSGFVGGLKYLSASKTSRQLWSSASQVLNKDVMIALPSARQIALNINSSIGDGIAAIDALTVSDDWVAAGIRKIKKDKNSIYVLPNLGKEKADAILSTYGSEVPFTKPKKIEGLSSAVEPASKRGAYLYFDSPFDQHVYAGGMSEGQLAKHYGLPLNQVKAIIGEVLKTIRDAELHNASGFKYKVIPDVPLPQQAPKLKAFRSVNDDVLMTYRELTPEQVGEFTKTGFFKDETVSYNGKNVRIEKFSSGTKPVTKTLYRGTHSLKPDGDADGSKFYTPDKKTASDYANRAFFKAKGAKGTVQESTITFKNLLSGSTWTNIRKKLGFPEDATEVELIEKAKELGYDGIEIKKGNTGGTEYVHIPSAIAKSGTKVQIRPTGGKIKWVSTDDVSRVAGGDKTVWNQRTFTDDIYNQFIEFANADRNGSPFLDLMERFAARNKWVEPGDKLKFEQFVYSKIAAEANLSPAGLGKRSNYDKLIADLNNKSNTVRNRVQGKLSANSYRVEPLGTGYQIIDIDGNIIGKFQTLEEIDNFALADFQNFAAPDLMAKSTAPVAIMEELLPPATIKHSRVERFIQSKFGQFFRRADRRMEDIARQVGDATLGVRFSDLMDQRANAIDAMTQGAAKPLVKDVEEMVRVGRRVPLDQQDKVTRALEMKSDAELRAMMSPEEIADADKIFALATSVGGIQRVKSALWRVRNGELKVKNIKDPRLAEVVVQFDRALKDGLLSNEKVLRYVDNLDSGENVTAAEYIANENFSPDMKKLYELSKSFYEKGASVFGIDNPISGYSPWLQKWDGFTEVFNKTSGNSSFIHELKRIGLTPGELKITNPVDLAYRYLKTGIHHKAPTPDGRTAGALLDEMTDIIEEVTELGRTRNIVVDTRPMQLWIDNSRGIPDMDEAQSSAYKKMAEVASNQSRSAEGFESAMDFIALTKLGFRPILAARDIIGSYAMASLYGVEAANDIMNFSGKRLSRIEGLSKIGELPQFSSEAMLSRTGRTKFGKLTDKSMSISLQPQVYKVIAGNMYIHTYDKTLRILNSAGGDLRRVVSEMGDLLDSNSRGTQEYFLGMAKTDPLNAAKFLARKNAYNVANKFGKLNNPLQWQGKYGRAFGQFGSWSLNALTVIMEATNNSRSKGAAAAKLARLAAVGTGVYLVSEATDTQLSNWVINPLTMIPGPGPLIQTWSDIRRGIEMSLSFDDDTRSRGRGLLRNQADNLLTPIVLKDILDGVKIWQEDANFYRAALTASGFNMQDEE